MKKFLFLIVILCICSSSFAQIPAIFTNEISDSSSSRTGITGDFNFNSTALTTKFLSKFYNGEYIDKESKNSVLDRTRNKNRIGAEANFGIFVAVKLDSVFHKKDVNFFFSVRDREHFDARYSDDFFKLGFYGNSQFAGKTAVLNDFNLTYLHYQQLQIGFFSSKVDSAARWGIGVSFLKGQQFGSILAKKAELFTSEDGQYINFDTQMQVAQSDTAHTGLTAFNGYGASIDVYFEAPLKTRHFKSKIAVSVADIGVIRFNKQSLYLKQDSLFHYTGFRINSIYDIQDSTFGHTTTDSVQNRIAPFKKQGVSITLPATLNITYETEFNKHFRLTEGVKYIYNANYNFMIYVKAGITINKHFMVSTTFGYGGYGKYNYGLGVFANFGNGFMVYAGSNNLEGYIAQNKASGLGGYLSLIKAFK